MDPDAVKEYQSLDNSVVDAVDKAIDELEIRADEVGKPLRNTQHSKLYGCKEIKLRSYGIRIIFRITNEVVDVLRIVYVLTIEQRSNDFVFKVAGSRYEKFKKFSNEQLTRFFKKTTRWKKKE